MYELRDGSSKAESCPRHACPFAIVAFSYGKMSTTSELEQKRFTTFLFEILYTFLLWLNNFFWILLNQTLSFAYDDFDN